MDFEILEFGRTSVVGAYLVVGLAVLVPWIGRGTRRLQGHSIGSAGTVIAVVTFYGLGLIIENISVLAIDERDFPWLSDERIRSRVLFERVSPRPVLENIGMELRTHFAHNRGFYDSTFARGAIGRFNSLAGAGPAESSWASVDRATAGVYFLAKSRAYRSATYSQELEEIKARAEFARSAGLVSLLLAATGVYVGWGSKLPRWAVARRNRRSAGWLAVMAAFFLLCYRLEEREYDVRVFGYFLELDAFPNVGREPDSRPPFSGET